MQEKFNKKIEDIFTSLDGMGKASAAPFFFTRLEARMEREKSVWDNISSFVTKPVIAFACICLVIMINAAVIFSSSNSADSADRQNNELATVDEYSQVSTSFYELVNTKP
jgi:hypothetical protein